MLRKLIPLAAGLTLIGGLSAAAGAIPATDHTANQTTALLKVSAPLKVTATLTPSQEVPKPKKGTKGSGTFKGSLSAKGKLTFTLTFKGLSGPVTGSHLHKGKPGKAGPVVVPLCPPKCSSPIKGTVTLSKKFIASLKSGGAYVNVHTAKNPAGEIRGLLKVG